MNNPEPKEIAQMLRKPDGEFGLKVAEKMNESNDRIIRWAIEKLALQNHDLVLEIGFGNGFHIGGLLRKKTGIAYTGLDFSETMVEVASKKHEEEIRSGQVSFHLGSSADLPFSSDAFDKIFTVNTLYFWEDPGVHLKQIFRVLKPGGVFSIGIKSRSFMQHLPFTSHGFTLYEQEEVAKLLKECGFTIMDVGWRKEEVREIAGKMLTPDAIVITGTKN